MDQNQQEMALMQQSTEVKNVEKLKAANIQADMLRIGFYVPTSQVVAKIYFTRRKLIWEISRNGLLDKIEIKWDNISAIRATIEENKPEILEIEIDKVPSFFHEIDIRIRRSHDKWVKTQDFTDYEQASKYRLHFLQFPRGVLYKHYKNLLQCDKRLLELSQQCYPSSEYSYFDGALQNIQAYGSRTTPTSNNIPTDEDNMQQILEDLRLNFCCQ